MFFSGTSSDFFPDEFKIGKRTIEKISERYGIELPEDEAGFIALHLVNAQTENNDQSNLYELTKTMQDIINIVKYYFKTTFDEESVYFYRFTTHLRFCFPHAEPLYPCGRD